MVSTNKNKVASIARDLKKYGIKLRHINMSLPELQSNDFNQVAMEKARVAFKAIGKPCIVQDSGFFVTSLNGFPGVLTHPVLDMIGIDGILKLTEGRNRECGFEHVIAYYDGVGEPHKFGSKTFGTMTKRPIGSRKSYHWSRLFEIYLPNGSKKTLSQMTLKEFRAWHDGNEHSKDVERFAKWYLKKESQ